jgi:hypothetical protein
MGSLASIGKTIGYGHGVAIDFCQTDRVAAMFTSATRGGISRPVLICPRDYRMIPKSGNRFSEKIMRKHNVRDAQ